MEQSTAMQHIDSFPLHQCVYPQAVSRWTPKMSHTSIGLDMFRWFSMVQLGRLKPWFFLFKCKGFNRIFSTNSTNVFNLMDFAGWSPYYEWNRDPKKQCVAWFCPLKCDQLPRPASSWKCNSRAKPALASPWHSPSTRLGVKKWWGSMLVDENARFSF